MVPHAASFARAGGSFLGNLGSSCLVSLGRKGGVNFIDEVLICKCVCNLEVCSEILLIIGSFKLNNILRHKLKLQVRKLQLRNVNVAEVCKCWLLDLFSSKACVEEYCDLEVYAVLVVLLLIFVADTWKRLVFNVQRCIHIHTCTHRFGVNILAASGGHTQIQYSSTQ